MVWFYVLKEHWHWYFTSYRCLNEWNCFFFLINNENYSSFLNFTTMMSSTFIIYLVDKRRVKPAARLYPAKAKPLSLWVSTILIEPKRGLGHRGKSEKTLELTKKKAAAIDRNAKPNRMEMPWKMIGPKRMKNVKYKRFSQFPWRNYILDWLRMKIFAVRLSSFQSHNVIGLEN